MGRRKAFPLPAGCNRTPGTRSFADTDLLGWIAVPGKAGSRSSLMLKQLPGLQEFAAYPNASRMRGARNVEGRLFFVVDNALCQLNPNGSIANLGTIPGIGRVTFSHNQITNGNEVFIATGTLGYVYNTVTAELNQITDEGFLGGLLADFIGARFVTLDPSRRFFQNSDLADGTEWNAQEYYAGESSPDRIRALRVINNELVLLSEGTIEHFAYTGTENALFENKGICIERGCASSHAVSVMDNALYFLGNDGSAYEKRGYDLQRISDHGLEESWGEMNWSKAFSTVWEDQGHKVWYLTFPDGATWGFDAATRQWHRRQSYNMDRWRIAWLIAWDNGDGRKWYAGDYSSGRIFRLNWAYPYEGSEPLVRSMAPGILHNDGNRQCLAAIRLEVEVGPSVEPSTVHSLVISGAMPDSAVGDTISVTYSALGGLAPYTYAVTAGAVPAGLTLDPDTGVLSGVLTTAEHDNAWTVTVTDSHGSTASIDDTAYVLNQVGDPPDSTNGAAYSYTLTGEEGNGPYTFVKTSGTLPTGTTLSSAGLISGTLTADGSFTFQVKMTDSDGVDQIKGYNIGVGVDYGTIFLGSAAVGVVPFAIVDGNTNTLTDTVNASTQIFFPTVNDAGTRVYYFDAQNIYYVQLSDNTVHRLTAVDSAFNGSSHLLIDSTETYIYGLDFSGGVARRVRVSDGVEVGTIACGDSTTMGWIDAGRTIIGFARYTDNYMRRYDTGAAAFLSNVPSATDLHLHFGIAWDVNTGYVYGCGSTDTVHYLLQFHPGGAATDTVEIPFEGKALAITPDGSKAYIVNDLSAGRVQVVNLSDLSLGPLITVGNIPNDVAVSAGNRVYVPCRGTDELYVIDAADDSVMDVIAVNDLAFGVSILEA